MQLFAEKDRPIYKTPSYAYKLSQSCLPLINPK